MTRHDSPSRPHPRSALIAPASVYVIVSRSGLMSSPCRTMSSPVFTTAVTSPGSRTTTTPRNNRAAPTPPASTVIIDVNLPSPHAAFRHEPGPCAHFVTESRGRCGSSEACSGAENGRMRRVAAFALSTALLAGLSTFAAVAPAAADEGPEFRELQFPVDGAVSFSDDFGDPRSGGRTHEGNDLLGTKRQHLVAAVDGTVTMAKLDASNLSGHMLVIKDADGWTAKYLHLNN